MKRRLTFDSIDAKAEDVAVAHLPLWRFTASSAIHKAEVDFTSLRGTKFEAAIVEGFRAAIARLRLKPTEIRRWANDVIAFSRFLAEALPQLSVSSDLTQGALESWVTKMLPHGPTSGTYGGYDTCMHVFHVIKEYVRPLSASAASRLTFIHTDGRPASAPLDSYPGEVLDQVIKVCRQQISDTLTRFESAQAAATRGSDPRGRQETDWLVVQNLMHLAQMVGPRGLSKEFEYARKPLSGKDSLSLPNSSEIRARLFPKEVDIVPFLLLFVVETGWPSAVVSYMKVGCKSKESRDAVTLNSFKPRAGHKRVHDRFPNNGKFTPGGIVDGVLSITKALRHSEENEELWLADQNARAGVCNFRVDANGPIGRFLQQFPIYQDGERLTTIDLRRLRKSHKERWYRKTNGQIERFARRDHGHDVAANNYADIPALRELHEETIAAGQESALRVALQPEVIPDAPAAAIEVENVPPSEDRWFASCKDSEHSPFETQGKPCRQRPGICLECSNARIFPRHLPAIVAYKNWISTERDSLTEADWRRLHGTAHATIETVVLPQFSGQQIELAKGAAGKLLLLPPNYILRGLNGR